MNIGLDARTLCSPKPRGTGRNLLDAYAVVAALRPDWRFTFYHQRPRSDCSHLCGPEAQHWPENVRWKQLAAPGDRWDVWFQLRLPWAAWNDAVDLLHFPANAVPAWCPVPHVATIHDLIPLSADEWVTSRQRQRFRRGVLRAARTAQRLITPSAATRDALVAAFRIAPRRTTVIPWAPDTRIAAAVARGLTAEELDRVRTRYGLGRNWMVNFAGQGLRKNAAGLLSAIAMLEASLRNAYTWVLAGCDDPVRQAALTAHAEALDIAENCRFLPFVPHADLPALLGGARALLIPSLHEGFGLPILDAFVCGVPVVCSDCSSLPEVADEAAVYCDPRRPASIAAAIRRIARPELSQRLVQLGYTRVQAYTWDRVARSMCAVFEQCLAATSEPALPAMESASCN